MAQSESDELITGSQAGSEVSPGQLTYFDDLNAIREHLFQSPLGPKSYILQRSRELFERPTYLIQSLNQAWIPKGQYYGLVDHNLLIEFYALDYEAAMRVSGDLLMLFASPGRGLVLPYWDVGQTDGDPCTPDPPNEPEILYDTYWEKCGFPPNSVPLMGVRILQETIAITNEQEDMDVADRQDWTVSMTLRAHAPRVLFDVNDPLQAGYPLTAVKLTGFISA